MNDKRIAALFGSDIVRAVQVWQERGYEVVEQMGVLTVSTPQIELVIARWMQQAQIKLLRPVQKEKNLEVKGPYDASQSNISVENGEMRIGIIENRGSTYSMAVR